MMKNCVPLNLTIQRMEATISCDCINYQYTNSRHGASKDYYQLSMSLKFQFLDEFIRTKRISQH